MEESRVPRTQIVGQGQAGKYTVLALVTHTALSSDHNRMRLTLLYFACLASHNGNVPKKIEAQMRWKMSASPPKRHARTESA